MKTNTKKIIELENQVKLLRAEMEKVQKHLGLPIFEEIIQRRIEFLDAELVRRGSGEPFREATKTSYEERLKEYLEAPVSVYQDRDIDQGIQRALSLLDKAKDKP